MSATSVPREPSAQPPTLVGRFELIRKLGEGAQATVWLARDPRMEREVALKLYRSVAGADEASTHRWLLEARNAGRLSHPHVVSLYEADMHGSVPYLVFEYIDGESLAQRLARQGPLPAHEAVRHVIDVLEGLSSAHQQGIVHLDVKPSNVLLDRQGQARLTDFGIAARFGPAVSGDTTLLSGTLSYLSPEAIAGAPPSPSMDLFACALVLGELLTGKPLVDATHRQRALDRLNSETLVLPATTSQGVDDTLRSIVQRGLARDPGERFADAQALATALRQWLQPAAGVDSAEVNHASGTLDFLIRRMKHKSDFPAMSASIGRVLSMASSESESIASITHHILQDVALTNKLLRIVNSAIYARGESVSTVSRAVQVVGFHGIRNLALSLVLLEHMQDKGHAMQLKEEFVRALLCGAIGFEMSSTHREAEDAFLGGMFRNLGRMLTLFYFPEESEQIRKLLQADEGRTSEASASAKVLGLNFEDLGLGVAKAWGLPEGIQRRMRQPSGAPPTRTPSESNERLRWMSEAANAISEAIFLQESEAGRRRLADTAKRYAAAVGMDESQMLVRIEKARAKLQEMAQAMDLQLRPGSLAHKVLQGHSPATGAAAPPAAGDTEGAIQRVQLQATVSGDSLSGDVADRIKAATDTLTAGIQDITNAMIGDFKLADVLRMVLETMFRAIGFDRIVFCMRDAKTDTVCGRLGLGEGASELAKKFRIPLNGPKQDLMAAVCLKGVDSMISDSTDPRIQNRLPQWYVESVNAPSFLLLPLHVKGVPLGLIYADKCVAGQLELDERELMLLRTLRSQAIMAFKHSS